MTHGLATSSSGLQYGQNQLLGQGLGPSMQPGHNQAEAGLVEGELMPAAAENEETDSVIEELSTRLSQAGADTADNSSIASTRFSTSPTRE